MITVVGEALVDLIERPPGTVVAHPGGSPANVAVALGRLGRPTSLLTQVGTDPYGRLLIEHFRDNGVRLAPGSLLDCPVTNVARTSLSPDGQAEYTFDVAWRAFAPPPVRQVEANSTCLHVGSIAAVLEPGSVSIDALINTASRTATISYDPNCRPSLMGNPARVRHRVEGLVAVSDIVKVSLDDLAWLYPGQQHSEVAKAWLDLGARLVVITLGADGAWGYTRHRATRIDAVAVDVIDTVGAGDAFMAGLIYACGEANLLGTHKRAELAAVDDAVLVDILQFASRIAAVTCGRRGADPPTLAELVPR
ncbi:carbohydrate kinase family protein [Dactylosporangium darangshiense]|uniref:Carbohydrate kinase n=1 Tax=Dactylosporangium darangshiense TaxID=579108 RepID=A0ABP8CX26_9ACTN